MKLLAVSLALLSLSTSIQSPSPSPTRPALVFQVQAEKRTFKPGEAIWVSALLRNQSDAPWYVPHAMTPCSGLEGQVEFELSAARGQLPLKGRGCGIGSSTGCGHDGCTPPSFPERVRASWVLLRPGEFWGARFDSYLDAPDRPGVYQVHARYVPTPVAEQDLALAKKDGMAIIQAQVDAQVFEITVKP
jgi:hypothetical protein